MVLIPGASSLDDLAGSSQETIVAKGSTVNPSRSTEPVDVETTNEEAEVRWSFTKGPDCEERYFRDFRRLDSSPVLIPPR